jgi:hypothetical protein
VSKPIRWSAKHPGIPILVRDLVVDLGGRLEHGATFGGTLRAGDFDVEIAVTVKRRVERVESASYKAESLAVLQREPWHRCHHSKENRGPWRISKTTVCDGSIAAVIVHKRTVWPSLPPGHYGPIVRPYGFDFVCSTHRDHPRIAACDIIEIVRFTETERAQLRKKREIHHTEKWKEFDRRQAERGKGVCPTCGHAELQIEERGAVEAHFPLDYRRGDRNAPLCAGGFPR